MMLNVNMKAASIAEIDNNLSVLTSYELLWCVLLSFYVCQKDGCHLTFHLHVSCTPNNLDAFLSVITYKVRRKNLNNQTRPRETLEPF